MHGVQDRKRVVSVDLVTGEPISGGAIGYTTGHLLRGGDRYGVMVVLDHEHEWEVVDPRPVHRLVPVTFGRGTLTPVHHGDLAVAADLQSVGDSGGVGELTSDHGRLCEDPATGVGPVTGQLTPAGGDVVLLGEDRQEHFQRSEPPRQADTHVPVVGEHPVPVPVEGENRSDLHSLVARRPEDECGAALALQGEHAIVDPPREEHQPVHLEYLAIGEAKLAMSRCFLGVQHRVALFISSCRPRSV